MKTNIERPEGYRYFHAISMMFVATLLISNAIAVKVISLWGFTLPAGIIVFPLAYLWGDILSILCYNDMQTAHNIQKWEKPVQEILKKHTDPTGKYIECQSVCYEFPPI